MKLFIPFLIAISTSINFDNIEIVDLIVYNAKVYTVDKKFMVSEAFAVKNGKIWDVGTNDRILSQYKAGKTIDAGGKSVFPGLIDAHCHFYGYGLTVQQYADFAGTKSFDEVLEILVAFAKENSGNDWILGRGWDQNDWNVKVFPTNKKLDKLFPDKPVMLKRIDGHAVLVNSVALKMVGITAKTEVKGGEIKTENGVLTGILVDNAAELVSSLVPEPSREMKTKALLKAQKNCFAVGLTSVQDAGLSKNTVLLIDELQKSGDLKMRIYAMLNPSSENFEYFVKKGKYKTKSLNVRSIKLYADGALGSRGAKLIKPYTDQPDNSGLLLTQPGRLEEFCQIAYKNKYQVNTHSIGDSAVHMMLEIYSELLKWENDRRWRIEHSQVVDKEDFIKYKNFNIIPSVQPTHATSDMYWADERLGSERIKYAYAYKDLLKQNGWLPAGSDFPVEDINPLLGFYAAVARMDLKGYPEGGFQSENALTRREALKAMTIWAAKAAFEEDEKGSIEIGKLADFVILDKDIMVVPIEEVPKVEVLKTFLGGEQVYGM